MDVSKYFSRKINIFNLDKIQVRTKIGSLLGYSSMSNTVPPSPPGQPTILLL